ncbi:hypothetical protein PO478_12660, partial [Citrobacter braakii]
SAQIREILISESAWEEMTCLFAPSLRFSASSWDRKKNCILLGCQAFATEAAFFSSLPGLP